MSAQVALPPTAVRAARRSPRVLVAGGGVGGLALAVGLRARGVTDVLVFERDASLESAAARSTGLALWPNGSAALRALSPGARLDIAAREAGELLDGVLFAPAGCSASAPPPARSSQEQMAARFGAPAVTLRWRSLVATLAAALPAATVHCDAALQHVEKLPGGGVRATFTRRDGSEAATVDADVLVGADGVRSRTRALLLGMEEAPRDAGRVAWRAVVPLTPALEALCPRQHSFMAAAPREGRTLTLMHLGSREFYWALGCLDAEVAADGPPTPGSRSNGDFFDIIDEVASSAAASFSAWPLAATLLAATPRGSVLQQRLCDREPLAPEALLDAGCVTLLGDALHAMIPSLGQGACSALEGALELAQCIAAAAAVGAETQPAKDELMQAALRCYEAARLERSTGIQMRSAQAGSAAYGKRPAGASADAPPAAPRSEDFMAWLHDYLSPHAELDAALLQDH
jgi:2-polyprenyl-6-methoxyphenol hydroxylase-like FAD-dependent oxidoreductase